MSRLDDRLARLATLSLAELKPEWERMVGSPCPALPAPLLRQGIAYRLQEKRHGSLPAMVTRELARVVAGEDAPRAAAPALPPGTQLFRECRVG